MKKILLLWFFLFSQIVFAQKIEVPKLEHYLTDQTNVLNENEAAVLERKLQTFEEQTSNQVTVLIIPTLGEESLEDFSIRVTEKNFIGQKKKDNGVLLLIVKDDRKIRMEVGYGLEGSLTDAITSAITRNIIAPSFREGNYFAGISNGVDAIMQATKGEFKGEGRRGKKGGGNIPSIFFVVIIIIVFIFKSIFGRRRFVGSGRGWGGGPYIGGFGGGGFGGGSGGGGFSGFSGGGGGFGGGGSSGSW